MARASLSKSTTRRSDWERVCDTGTRGGFSPCLVCILESLERPDDRCCQCGSCQICGCAKPRMVCVWIEVPCILRDRRWGAFVASIARKYKRLGRRWLWLPVAERQRENSGNYVKYMPEGRCMEEDSSQIILRAGSLDQFVDIARITGLMTSGVNLLQHASLQLMSLRDTLRM